MLHKRMYFPVVFLALFFQKIIDSINNGIEGAAFAKMSECC
jgi:hypothetical protein